MAAEAQVSSGPEILVGLPARRSLGMSSKAGMGQPVAVGKQPPQQAQQLNECR